MQTTMCLIGFFKMKRITKTKLLLVLSAIIVYNSKKFFIKDSTLN